MSSGLHLALLALAWILYAALHSALAAVRLKAVARARFPRLFPGYRLAYNGIALLALLPPLALLISYPGQPLWRWPAPFGVLTDGLAVLAVLGFLWTLRYYDTAEFLGTRQWRQPTSTDDTPALTLSPLHRWVRHPWYFLGLVLLWTREMNAALLVTALVLSLYLLIGSRLEDGKLAALYGETYQAYRKKVPGLLPRPWKHLTRAEAKHLLQGRREADPMP